MLRIETLSKQNKKDKEICTQELIKDLKNCFIEWQWEIIEGEEGEEFILESDIVEIISQKLFEIGEPAVNPLTKALKDKDKRVHNEAKTSLKKIRWSNKGKKEKNV